MWNSLSLHIWNNNFSTSRKMTCKGMGLRGRCLRPRTPYPTPLHSVYVYCIQVYLFTQGRGAGREAWTREKVSGASSQRWIENTNMIYCISSLLTLINTCRKVPLQVNFFRWRHFVLVSIKLMSPCVTGYYSTYRLACYSDKISLKSFKEWSKILSFALCHVYITTLCYTHTEDF
jgi:hypothetical protein